MGKRFYTVFFVPDNPAKVRRLRIPEIGLKAAGVVLVAFFVLYLSTTWSYFGLKQQADQWGHFKKLALAQKMELEKFTSKISDLENRMEKLRQLDEKFSSMLNLKQRRVRKSRLGKGSITEAGQLVERSSPGWEAGLPERIEGQLSQLEIEARLREHSFARLDRLVTRQRNVLKALPSITPAFGRVSSRFGPRVSPFSGRRSVHKGIDIANRRGTPVVAPGAGKVILVGRDRAQGKLISLDHGYGIVTRYGHLHTILVKKGQWVKRGEKIGKMGNTGLSTGPHLHYEVRLRGVPVNPERYVLE